MPEAENESPLAQETPLEYVNQEVRERVDLVDSISARSPSLLPTDSLTDAEMHEVQILMLNALYQNPDILQEKQQWMPMADRLLRVFENMLHNAVDTGMRKTLWNNLVPVSDDEFEGMMNVMEEMAGSILIAYEEARANGEHDPMGIALSRARLGEIKPIFTTREWEAGESDWKNPETGEAINLSGLSAENVALIEEETFLDMVVDMTIGAPYEFVQAFMAHPLEHKEATAIKEGAIIEAAVGLVGGKILTELWKKIPAGLREACQQKASKIKDIVMQRTRQAYGVFAKRKIDADAMPSMSLSVANTGTNPRKQMQAIENMHPHPHLQGMSLKNMRLRATSLPREGRRQALQEVREVVEYSRNIGVNIVGYIKQALEQVPPGDVQALQKTADYQKAMELSQALPQEYLESFVRKINAFEASTAKLQSLQELTPQETVEKIFGFKPLNNFSVRKTAVATEVELSGHDLMTARNRWTGDYKKVGGFASEHSQFGSIIANGANNGHVPKSVRVHEQQHREYAYMKPTPAEERVSYPDAIDHLLTFKVTDIEDMPKILKMVFTRRFDFALQRAKDEALAFAKDMDGRGHFILKVGEEALYDYTEGFRDNVIKQLRSRPDAAMLGDIEGQITALHQEYLRVAKNLADCAQINNYMIDTLAITPYKDWWRLPNLTGRWSRQDFTLNLRISNKAEQDWSQEAA